MRLLVLFLFCNFAIANERILDFHSRVQILDNGSIHVIESIKVNVENRQIRRGIYRSTPTIYFGIFLSRSHSNITIMNTKLDGIDVPYHTERLLNGIRVYLGSKDSYVSRGIHTYQIEYIADRQVVELEGSEGIYWNVTGNDWDFQIDKASIDIYFSEPVTILTQDAWTGTLGSKQQNYTQQTFTEHISFETTKPLYKQQGLTIQATWQENLVINPTNKTWAFITDNVFWFLSILMLAWFPLFYYFTWKCVGIDPPKKPVFARFEPPQGMSPAAVRFISRTYYDGKCFACAMMNLAVKKYVNLEQRTKKQYTFTKLEEPSNIPMSKGESSIYEFLFTSNDKFSVDSSYNPKTKVAYSKLKNSLQDEYQDACYKNNNKYWYYGVALSIVALFFNWGHFFNFSQYATNYLIMPVIAILLSALGLVQAQTTLMKWLAIVLPTLATLVSLSMQSHTIYIAYIIVTLIILLVNALFYYLIQSPTIFGSKILNQISGFKMYLNTAEQDRLELLHPPTMTPELFEKYLPYALALGVENKWSEQFSQAMKIQGKDVTTYHPDWFIGNNYSNFSHSSAISSIGSGLAGSVISSATPPSSSGSGGFGGGGFSGGGGGGGGGGGW